VQIFLNGTAMSGQADQVFLRGAPLLGTARTAPRYRFYAVRGEFPGLVAVESGGRSIEGELYDIDDEVWRTSLGPAEPRELALGEVELDDGQTAHAMILDTTMVRDDEIVDITELGGWRAFLRSTGADAPAPRTS